MATELAVNDTSPTKVRSDADWDARGDAINDEIDATWAALPMTEVRDRLRTVPGQLRGYLTVVPETRWLKHPDNQRFFHDETTAHYEEHLADLEAILAAARAMNLRDLLEEEAADLPGTRNRCSSRMARSPGSGPAVDSPRPRPTAARPNSHSTRRSLTRPPGRPT